MRNEMKNSLFIGLGIHFYKVKIQINLPYPPY